MQLEHLERLIDLAEQGAPIVFGQVPEEPGLIKHARYALLLDAIRTLERIELDSVIPVLSSDVPLDFWCRKDRNDYYLFISHPKMRKLRYPLPYAYHEGACPTRVRCVFHSPMRDYPLELAFPKARSLLCRIRDDQGLVEFIDPDS